MKGLSVLLKKFLDYNLKEGRVIKKLMQLFRNKLVYVCHLQVNFTILGLNAFHDIRSVQLVVY
jgi:hypothetical protein